MLRHVLRSCAGLWVLGILGMWAARSFASGEAAEAPFRAAAGCWILGGIGFTCFALLGLLVDAGRASALGRRAGTRVR